MFRPAMQLSSGELASLGGITLLQTATATCKTISVLEEEFPEVRNWSKIINLPYRSDISIIIPPPKLLPGNFQTILNPFIRRMIDFDEPHLIITRSIKEGTEVYFHLLKKLGCSLDSKVVALYHRSVSEKRRQEILSDLSLPIQSPEKKLKAVVATISLGVGVDVRVKNVVCLGLGSTPENIIQEAGRCLRGNQEELKGLRGLAFFFHKGSVAAIHCPPSSDCRSLVADPLPACQTKHLLRYFDPNFDEAIPLCDCCYSCILQHSSIDCQKCSTFFET